MIITKDLTTVEDFAAVRKGDLLAVEWKQPQFKGDKLVLFAVYRVYANRNNDVAGPTPEIILQRNNNVWFDYAWFCEGDPESLVKSVMLIASTAEVAKWQNY